MSDIVFTFERVSDSVSEKNPRRELGLGVRVFGSGSDRFLSGSDRFFSGPGLFGS